jgi:L-arabinose isomerase
MAIYATVTYDKNKGRWYAKGGANHLQEVDDHDLELHEMLNFANKNGFELVTVTNGTFIFIRR